MTRRACWCLMLVSLVGPLFAADPSGDSPAGGAGSASRTLRFSIRVVDEKGTPVAKVKVAPWALRSSVGHGSWDGEERKRTLRPKEVVTDDRGEAVVEYPVYHDPVERVRVTAVSLNVDHSDFAYIGLLEVEVPRDEDEPRLVTLTPGVPVEVRPLIDGVPADLDRIDAVWSDGRSWKPGYATQKTKNGTLKLPALAPGKNSVLLMRSEGDRATHFSRIVDFDLEPGQAPRIDVPLRPAARLGGVLSDDVPRPVGRGRVSVATLSPSEDFNRVWWLSWTTITPDGSFVIDSWPADERLQVIALCDGFIAASGSPPPGIANPEPVEDLDTGSFRFPQVFPPDPRQTLTLEMRRMGRCAVSTRDKNGKPVPGLTVVSYPNVQWWNGGSQVYGEMLMSSQRALKSRDWTTSATTNFPSPFESKTGADGKTVLELPIGQQPLYVISDTHELPIQARFGNQRCVELRIQPDQTAEVLLPPSLAERSVWGTRSDPPAVCDPSV